MLIYDGLHYDALAVCHSPFSSLILVHMHIFVFYFNIYYFLMGRNKDVTVGPIQAFGCTEKRDPQNG